MLGLYELDHAGSGYSASDVSYAYVKIELASIGCKFGLPNPFRNRSGTCWVSVPKQYTPLINLTHNSTPLVGQKPSNITLIDGPFICLGMHGTVKLKKKNAVIRLIF